MSRFEQGLWDDACVCGQCRSAALSLLFSCLHLSSLLQSLLSSLLFFFPSCFPFLLFYRALQQHIVVCFLFLFLSHTHSSDAAFLSVLGFFLSFCFLGIEESSGRDFFVNLKVLYCSPVLCLIRTTRYHSLSVSCLCLALHFFMYGVLVAYLNLLEVLLHCDHFLDHSLRISFVDCKCLELSCTLHVSDCCPVCLVRFFPSSAGFFSIYYHFCSSMLTSISTNMR